MPAMIRPKSKATKIANRLLGITKPRSNQVADKVAKEIDRHNIDRYDDRFSYSFTR